jgi:hypothetical protein
LTRYKRKPCCRHQIDGTTTGYNYILSTNLKLFQMKKQIFFTLFIIFIGFGCKKDISSEQQQFSTTATASVDEKQMVKDQAEGIGKTAYRHLKFYLTQKKAEDYVNPLIRKEVMESVEKAKVEYKDLTAEQTIQKVTNDGKMTKEMSQKMTDLLAICQATSSLMTIQEIEKKYKNFEEVVYADKTLSSDEKFYVSGISAAIRNVANFTDEMLKGQKINNNYQVSLRDVGCDWIGRKSSCFGNALIKAGTATAVADFSLWIQGGPKKVDPNTSYFKAGKIAFLTGLLEGIINMYLDNSCKCTDAPSSDGCYHPQVINPIVDINHPCSPYIAFAVFGYGPTPNIFTWNGYWTDSNGVEHPINDVQSKTTSIPILRPFSVPDPNASIRLQVIVSCSTAQGGAYTAEFIFKMSDLINDPGTVMVSGPSQISLNSTGMYTISGGCLANPLNTYSWNNPSAGYVVSGGNTTSATIKFTTRTCYSYNGWTTSCFPVSVAGNAISGCLQTNGTYKTNSGSMSVTVP